MRTSRGTIVLAQDRCKGCELCVRACPINVLSMSPVTNSLGYSYPLLEEGCTGCTACQAMCPDFALEVYKFEEVR
jgi:2-oxoglutarate ferredoxin oxidoreductase subunit delta